ncbi:hypothetical protein ACWDRB_52925 [Nonomuraea sp. NPDC003707]
MSDLGPVGGSCRSARWHQRRPCFLGSRGQGVRRGLDRACVGSVLDMGGIGPAWEIVYDGFDLGREGLREALCTLGNGRFATRGATPDGESRTPGTYVAGCYDRLDSEVAGRTVTNEDIVNLPDWLPLTFATPGCEWFRPERATGHSPGDSSPRPSSATSRTTATNVGGLPGRTVGPAGGRRSFAGATAQPPLSASTGACVPSRIASIGARGCRSRSGIRRPIPSAGCRGPGCRRRP